jgi:hypothetical protein
VIVKTIGVKTNSGDLAYKFASIEQIEEVIRPIEAQNGFNHTFNQDVSSKDGWVISECIVTHTAGHARVTKSMFPLGGKTAIMSATQQYAAALTFANRRTLANAYGLVIAGEDKDGAGKDNTKIKVNQVQPTRRDPHTDALATELWKILAPVRGTAKNWIAANQFLYKYEILDGAIPEAAPDLSVSRFEAVILKAKSKIQELYPS